MNDSLIPMTANEQPQVAYPPMPASVEKAFARVLGNMATAMAKMMFHPKKILKVGRVTVVFWEDGSSTAVKCGENEIPDDYVAFCAALGKKVFGTNTALKRAFMDAPHETKEP
jgi:hypothetical protein